MMRLKGADLNASPVNTETLAETGTNLDSEGSKLSAYPP